MTSRREFLAVSAGVGLAGLMPERGTHDGPARRPQEAPTRSLRILILGGTGFLGPHQIAYAMERGHAITTFTRGRTDPTVHGSLFHQVEQLVGDRESDLSALRTGTWDAVIDNSGRRVEWTRASAALLRDRAERYLYTSSTGVYYPYLGRDIREDTEPVLEVPRDIDETQSGEYGFGVMKANSEIAAKEEFGAERTLVVRPTYIMGPGDRTDRFTYWPVRLARGGDVMVPGKADDPVQHIDVRDLASWMIRLIEGGVVGTLNAVGPASATGMHQFVHGAHAAFSSPVEFVPVTDYDFLAEHGVPYVVPWIMPVGDNFGSARVSNERALAHGLTLRPLADSVRDLHEWWWSDALADPARARLLTAESSLIVREPRILAAWRARG
jgi:2'-hydroxyisoflavone reductase